MSVSNDEAERLAWHEAKQRAKGRAKIRENIREAQREGRGRHVDELGSWQAQVANAPFPLYVVQSAKV